MKTNPSIEPILHPRRSLLSLLLLPATLLLAHCSVVPHTKATLTQNRELEAFETIAAYPSSDARVVLVAMQEFIASKREWEGYDYPASESLRAGRAHALTMLKERYAPINPFRFILCSEWSNQPFAALEPGAAPDGARAAPTPASTGAINMHIHNE